jgi:hypothetical protein
VTQLGANAHGEVLEPGRVADCYLGLAPGPARPQRAGRRAGGRPGRATASGRAAAGRPLEPGLYALVTGHPDRTPRELVFLADLTVELHAWPTDTWSKVGIDPQVAARAVIDGWQDGHLPGLRVGGLSDEEALALERPAMTYVRGQLGDRLGRQLARASRRWRHPTSGHLPGDRFL